MKLIIIAIIALLAIVAVNIPTTTETPSVTTGGTLPISEPTGRTYNPQQTIDGKTLQGSEL